MAPIGVGIVGLSARRGWAGSAHVPALRAVPGYELLAVSASTPDSAQDAAAQYGVSVACRSAEELVARSDVDLVVVTVKVPHHYELVMAALDAGKTVLCEWPLGNGLAEAEELAVTARQRAIRGFVGLQGRASPAVRYVRELIRTGRIGEVLSTTLVGSAATHGAGVVGPDAVYLLDRANGATMLTITCGHTLDALCFCLGEFRELQAATATRRPLARRSDTGESVRRTAPDEVAVVGVLEGGAVASIHYHGGSARASGLRWEIRGTEGELVVYADQGSLQIVAPGVRAGASEGDLGELNIPSEDELVPGTPGTPSYNVAQAYARLLADLAGDSAEVPTFEDAVIRHRMIDAIERSSSSGTRVSY
jgi:predicted dehydrogenase